MDLKKKSKFHVPGYMDLKKKQNIMYLGTWIGRKNKIPCTGEYMNLKEKNNLMCSSGGGKGPAQKKKNWQFFSTCEIINQF